MQFEQPSRHAPEPSRPPPNRFNEAPRVPESRQHDEHSAINQHGNSGAGFREHGEPAPIGVHQGNQFSRVESAHPGSAERGSDHRAMPASLEQHGIRLSRTATVVANSGHPGFTAVNRLSAHASIVVEQRVDAQGQAHVNAYRQTTSADGRTTTRVYTDGRRIVDGATFHSSGRVSGPQFVRYNNGLRAAYMPDGRPLYAESFATRWPSMAGGGAEPIVQRTIYATSLSGQIRVLPTPIRRYYTVTRFGGYDTFVYRPIAYGAAVYAVLYAPLAFQIAVGPQCLVCPDPNAVFAVPPERYSDPIELLGDMQVADAVTDQGAAPIDESDADQSVPAMPGDGAPTPSDQASVAPDASVAQDASPPAPPASASPPPPPPPPPPSPPPGLISADAASGADSTDLDKLKQQSDELQAQAAARANVQPTTPNSNNDQSPATVIPTAAVSGVAAATGDTLAVPEDVRLQIHKEVRLSLAEHANEHPMTLIDIIQSGYSRIYLFQVAGAIDTSSVITGDSCALGSGDLLAFASLGDAQQRPTAQMKVVTAGAGHCLSHDIVEVSIGDLQDMLNTFNQRLEENIHKLNACVTAKAGCVRS
jgi:hypothetical protein